VEPLYYDQYDYTIDDNPFPVFKRLRDEAPAWFNEKYGFWVLSRYEDVIKASRDTSTFSSAHGTVLEIMTDEPSQTSWILNNDPPFHGQMRSVVAARFTPSKIAQMESDIRKIVIGYLQPLEGKDTFDFVQDFGRWIPMEVVSTILGVKPEDRKAINQWADDMLHRDEGETGEPPLAIEARNNLFGYFAQALQERRQSPSDDLMTVIANGQITESDGSQRALSDREAIEFIVLIAAAGNETVARLLGSAAWLLAKHPDQRQKLRDNPGLIPRAAEEMLRVEPPTPIQFRRVKKDVELHGAVIPAGSNVCLLTASAGRDERQYPNPDSFDIEREAFRHVSFGHGIHLCLGAAVARMEIRIALEEVLHRIPDWDIDEQGLQRVRTSTVRGFSHVPVVIRK
jgi:cytochrome P450